MVAGYTTVQCCDCKGLGFEMPSTRTCGQCMGFGWIDVPTQDVCTEQPVRCCICKGSGQCVQREDDGFAVYYDCDCCDSAPLAVEVVEPLGVPANNGYALRDYTVNVYYGGRLVSYCLAAECSSADEALERATLVAMSVVDEESPGCELLPSDFTCEFELPF